MPSRKVFGEEDTETPVEVKKEKKQHKKEKATKAEAKLPADNKRDAELSKKEEKNKPKEERKRKERDEEKDKKEKKVNITMDSGETEEPSTKKKKTSKATETVHDKSKNKKVEPENSSQVDDADTEAWRNTHNMTILGERCLAPFKTFAEATFPGYIHAALKTLKFENPTPIQAQCWPLALAGRDMIGLAETGSGKTLAFMLPGIVHLSKKPKANRVGPSVLVLAPTRELAQQIEGVTAKTCAAASVKSCCVYGGMSKGPQATALKGAEVVIATPGRPLDFVEEGTVKLNNVSYLVFDEADRMLDLGFELQINQIMRSITANRQTLMFSATWPSDVQRLAQKFFNDPIRVTIGSENLSGAKKVTQIVEVCEEWEKKKMLTNLLNKVFKDNCRILIFMLYKHSTEQMTKDLARDGWPVVSIHGDKSQNLRNQALAEFKHGKCPILIATDVAARGLDIKEVKYVINVEFPLKCEDYVHRIGRTGRAGEAGTAITYFTAENKAHARELVQIMRESNQEVDEKLLAIADKAPGIKPKKNAMQQLYGDFAPSDLTQLAKKPTRITFDD